jgi:Putative zinc-finger
MITCKEVSGLVTEYYDGEMGMWRKMNFRMHIAMCKDCTTHLGKMRQLIDSMGYIPPETEVPPEMLERLKNFLF